MGPLSVPGSLLFRKIKKSKSLFLLVFSHHHVDSCVVFFAGVMKDPAVTN